MVNNKTIVKYCVKYFCVIGVGSFLYDVSTKLINQKSDIANLVGSALCAGLFIAVLLILKSDVTKLVKSNKNNKNNK